MRSNAYVCSILLGAAMIASASGSAAQPSTPALEVESEQARFRLVEVARGLEYPWSVAFLPGGDILVAEQPGRLRIIRRGALLARPVAGLPEVYYEADAGLMDVAVAPDFARTRTVFLSYSAGDVAQNRLEVFRARLVGDALVDGEVVFRALRDKKGHGPLGGRILPLPDGTLLVSVGDGYDVKEVAQDLGTHLGSIIRIDADGRAPADNPFIGDDNALPEIFTYGHRTPQGLARRAADGAVWTHEHGPKGGDEINILKPGANYGWPLATYGRNYDGTPVSAHFHVEGTEPPAFYWLPSTAPSGMAFYEGLKFPEWRDDLFIGALAGRRLHRLEIDGDRVQHVEDLLVEFGERIRDVRVGPDGFIYLVTDEEEGRVLRIEPAAR